MRDCIIADSRAQELIRLGFKRSSSLSCNGLILSGWRDINEPEDVTLFTAEVCSSTMDLMQRLVSDGLAPIWSSVLCRAQLSGRGQFGRVWRSPPGNMYGSLRIPALDEPWQNLSFLLVAAGALGVLLDLNLDARLKWPNDILVGSRKVCGILIEEREGAITAGIGLNIKSAPDPSLLRDSSATTAACLTDFGVNVSAPEMWLLIVRAVKRVIMDTTSSISAGEFVENMASCLAYKGETVIIDRGNDTDRTGTLVGLNPHGGIKIKTSAGDEVFHSGALRPLFSNRDK